MNQEDFKLDTTFTDSSRNWIKPTAVVSAIVLVLGIILTMTTDVASRILPMDESYLTALVPRAPDGAEPLSLKALEQEIVDKTLTVRGSVENRTDYSVSGIAAVIQPLDMYGIPLMTVEIFVEPPDVPAHSSAMFQTTVTLNERPAGYSIKFRLMDGPFGPHKDERAPAGVPAPAPTQ